MPIFAFRSLTLQCRCLSQSIKPTSGPNVGKASGTHTCKFEVQCLAHIKMHRCGHLATVSFLVDRCGLIA